MSRADWYNENSNRWIQEGFSHWADAHLPAAASRECVDGVYVDQITRWAFEAFAAGWRRGSASRNVR